VSQEKRDDRVLMGRFGAAHGIRGALRLVSHMQDPAAIATIGPLCDAQGKAVVLTSLRVLRDNLCLVEVAGVTDRNRAEALTNSPLYIQREHLPPPAEDEFYHADLIGLAAHDGAGQVLGRIIAVPDYGGGTLIEIAPVAGGETILVPFTKACVPHVDIAAGVAIIIMPEETDGETRGGAAG
jgi:16S rRNA processing protein RimM